MNNPELTNVLLVVLLIVWYAKISFHFKYLKETVKFKHTNFVSFFINGENLFKIIQVVMPMFWSPKQQHAAKEKRRVWLFTVLLWVMFALIFFQLYRLSPEEKVQHVRYDLTK